MVRFKTNHYIFLWEYFPPHPSRLGVQVKNRAVHVCLWDWTVISRMMTDAARIHLRCLSMQFHLPSWKWHLLGNPAGFIRNPNHLAAFCPEPSLQLLIICYVSRFCSFLIVKVAATNSFHLGWYCCIDGCRGSFLWSLQKQKPQQIQARQIQQKNYITP